MNFIIMTTKDGSYLDCSSSNWILRTEDDVLELVSVCISNNIHSLLLHEQSMSPDFFKLKTGLAGAVLNKFQIYNIRTAFVVQDEKLLEGRFGEMAMELNKGTDFRICNNPETAIMWLKAAR